MGWLVSMTTVSKLDMALYCGKDKADILAFILMI
jgi:hypothetical protein